MDKRYLFRADGNYKEGQGLVCKNPKANYTVNQHVGAGTDIATKFISTTAKISIAAIKYSQGEKIDSNGKRAKVVLIDFGKLKSLENQQNLPKKEQYIYDFTDEEQVEKYLRGRFQQNAARSDREVTVNGRIPPECCKEIPPIFVDILTALETDIENNLSDCDEEKRKQIQEVGEVISNNILDMIMQGKNNALNRIINRVNFNSLEKKFIELYYEQRKTLGSAAKVMFGEMEQGEFWANAILTGIIKKVINDKGFLMDTYPSQNKNMDSNQILRIPIQNEFISMVTDSYIAPFSWQKQTWEKSAYTVNGKKQKEYKFAQFLNKFSDYTVNKYGTPVSNMTATAVVPKTSGIMLFKTMFLEINKKLDIRGQKQDVIFPVDMKYQYGESENEIISAVPQYVRFDGKENKFSTCSIDYAEKNCKKIVESEMIKTCRLTNSAKIKIGQKIIDLEMGKEIIEHALRGSTIELGEAALAETTTSQRMAVGKHIQNAIEIPEQGTPR